MTIMARPYGGTGLALEDLEALPRRDREAILAGSILQVREQIAELRQQLAESESLLRDAMLGRGASVADAGRWTVKLTTKRSYVYDEEALSRLQAFLEPEQYEEAVRTIVSTKVNKTVLNQLCKRGGEVAQIIAAATTDVVDGYTLEVKPA